MIPLDGIPHLFGIKYESHLVDEAATFVMLKQICQPRDVETKLAASSTTSGFWGSLAVRPWLAGDPGSVLQPSEGL